MRACAHGGNEALARVRIKLYILGLGREVMGVADVGVALGACIGFTFWAPIPYGGSPHLFEERARPGAALGGW